MLALKFDEDADHERKVEIIGRVNREEAQFFGLPGPENGEGEESRKYEVRVARLGGATPLDGYWVGSGPGIELTGGDGTFVAEDTRDD